MAKRTTKKTGKKTGKRAPKRAARPSAAAESPAEPMHPAPIALDAVVGHDAAKAQLLAAVASDRLHHAWIFHGPRGVGKFTTALAFAALVLDDEAAPDLTGRLSIDSGSRVQRLLAAGSHPDLHIVSKELARFSEDPKVRAAKLTTIPKDVVETHLLRPAALRANVSPGGAASKVFIVDEAELLDRSPTNAPVQNALLKTLEEPPDGTLIVLVTSAEDRILPTIRSRCQRVRFGTLGRSEIESWLATVSVTPEQAGWASDHGQGSPGLILEAVRTGLDQWRPRLEPRIREALAGGTPAGLGGDMAQMVSDWAAARVDEEKQASKDAANRSAAARMFGVLGDIVRDTMRAADDPWLAVDLADRLHAVQDAQRRLDANVNLQMVFEALAAELAYPRGAAAILAR
ncbi:MAG: hypothetical protein AAGB48_04440 [Planctomycetota bacterium]